MVVELCNVAVGTELCSTGSFVVTAECISSFANQWDPHPLHVDKEAAVRAGQRDISAPGALVHAISISLRHGMTVTKQDGGLDDVGPPLVGLAKHFRTRAPVYAGDVLTLRGSLVSKRISASKPDLAVVTLRFLVKNQSGTVVYEEDDTVLTRVVSKNPSKL